MNLGERNGGAEIGASKSPSANRKASAAPIRAELDLPTFGTVLC